MEKRMNPTIIKTDSETKIEVVREFNSNIESVWKPFTDSKLIPQWMVGPPGWSMPVCEIDFKVGGKYRNIFRNQTDGSEITISGIFCKIEIHKKIVQDESHIIGDMDSGVINKTVVTLTFEEVSGGIRVTTLIEYGSKEQRDEALKARVEPAMEMGYCQIDKLLVCSV